HTFRRQVLHLSPLPVPLLILDDPSNNTKMVARCIHYFGPRADQPFVTVTFAALPEQSFEAELFGPESDAFTDTPGK
ncbi:sigma 54-interacting transcriptional regulator, partial [Pseudomonas graminis]|uniref:sigma 54-interacting transcriptional regulator n=1 Tax=Pseudomonas graminis TaxID=158627 RepID=UPI003C14E1CD